MKYYLIAGEASGDLHASNLMRSILRFDKDADFRFFGGDLMQETGGTLVRHYREMAFMGLVDVLANIRTISKNLEFCKSDIASWKPDAIILVDYAGFNLRVAEYAKNAGIKVFYYISPKVWAWRKSRIEKLRKFTDRIFVIFPFEVEFFRNNELEVEFFGNPLMDSFANYKRKKVPEKKFREDNNLGEEKIIALLAGSRKHEVKRCLPEMLKASSAFPEFRFVIAGSASVPEEIYRKIIGRSRVDLLFNKTYDILNTAEAAVVTSGTATLETAIFKVPQVVIYKTSPVNYIIGRPFIRIRFFSLVNLIAGKELVKELLQFNLAKKITRELNAILRDKKYQKEIKNGYNKILDNIGSHGTSERVAARITEILKVI
jgi:lipid-A-disaccharide synthase